jgi:hypothetical protein
MGYGRVFAWLVPKAPRALLGAGVLLMLGGVVASVRYVQRDPMEYNLQATENDPDRNLELHRVWDKVIEILGAGHEGMVVLTDTPEEAHELEKKLLADWEAALDVRPFTAVHSLWDAVPDDQEAKIPILLETGERLERARAKGFLSDDEWRKIADVIPPHDLRPYGLADLPESIARPFAEKDGTRGRLVVIEPDPRGSNDLRYLLRYSESFRETRLASGKIVHGSGRAVIFADVLKAVVHDIRRAMALSFTLTILAVLLTFRHGGRHAASVLFALLVGVAGEVVFLYAADGGAVVLCSLTTTLGYLALIGSQNRAIRSLGVIAVVGEVSCLLAAMTVLPALWLLIERRQQNAGTAPGRTSGTPP